MSVVLEIESRFTGMIFLLQRIFPDSLDGRLRSSPRPDMGFAVRRPRRS